MFPPDSDAVVSVYKTTYNNILVHNNIKVISFASKSMESKVGSASRYQG